MSISNLLSRNQYHVYANSFIMESSASQPSSTLPNNIMWINSANGHVYRDGVDLEDSAPAPSGGFGVYVNKDGSDVTGTGSILNPYLTITFAMSQVTFAGLGFPVGIFVGPGVFVEANLPIKANVFIVGSGQDVTFISITTSSTLGTGWGLLTADKSGFQNLSIEGAGALTYDFSAVLSANGIIEFINCIIYGGISALTLTGDVGSISNILSLVSCIFDIGGSPITLNNCRLLMNISRINNVAMNNTIAGISNVFSNSALNNLTGSSVGFAATITAINSTCSGGLLNLNGPITLTSTVEFNPINANITLAGGAVLVNLNDAFSLNYTPVTPANWPIVPTTVQAALDSLSSTSLADANTFLPTVANQGADTNVYVNEYSSYQRIKNIVSGEIWLTANAASNIDLLVTVPIASATNLSDANLTLSVVANGVYNQATPAALGIISYPANLTQFQIAVAAMPLNLVLLFNYSIA